MKRKIALGLALLLCLCLNAVQKITQRADYAFEMKQYYLAITEYKAALPKEGNKAEKARIQFMIGESYRMQDNWKEALPWYEKARKGKYADDVVVLYIADALRFQGKYAEALKEYETYTQLVPSSPDGPKGVLACSLASRWLQDSINRWRIENESQLNTKEHDFSPTYSDKKHQTLIFTSKRAGQTGSKVDPISGELYSDLFEAGVDKNGKWSTPQTVQGTLNEANYNEGASCVTKKGDHIYYTQCGQVKNREVTCKIFMATKKGNAWDNPILIDFGMDMATLDSFNFRHPTVSADESVMVFSSDMRGTTGGEKSDLWISYYDKRTKKWSKPQNMGAGINTAGREGFPVLREDGTLYFSSDGHIGMGGLDLFVAQKKTASAWSWSAPENMKMPFNSPADDFGIAFDGLKDRGYLTSNRNGTKGGDDIWRFYKIPCALQIQGVVRNCENQNPVANAIVEVVGSVSGRHYVRTDKSGFYSYKLAEDEAYVVNVLSDSLTKIASGSEFFNLSDKDKMKLSTLGECGKNFNADFCIKPVNPVEIAFPAVLYDVGKWNLRPESKDSLNYLYQILIDNPTLVIEIGSHTDSRASNASNDTLSQRRAQACVDYLVKEKGIAPERLVAKGYGENRPLKLSNGLVLTEKYIRSLPAKEQEAYYQLNRRTVFRVINWNYVDPKNPNLKRGVPVKVRENFFDESGESEEVDEKTDEKGETEKKENVPVRPRF
jgi:peptidoglycan-associated lipoprotein